MPMDPITGMVVGQGIGSIFSGLFSGGDAPELDPRLEQMILALINEENSSGFLPNKEAFDQSFRAKAQGILAQLPIQSEAFEADLASRGIRGSGEAVGAKYRQVYAPIAQATGMAAAEAELGYATAYQRGSIAQKQLKSQNVNMLMQAHLAKLGYQYQEYVADQTGKATFWGDIGTAAGYLGANNYGKIFKWAKQFLGV